MRQIVLDTETTGLDWRTGDRIVEIGCVEMIDRRQTGRTFHVYLNPERDVGDSERIHGLSDEFLAGKPLYTSVASEFEIFVADAELIIHNASFDVGFLNMEQERLGRPRIAELCPAVVDTVKLAKEMFPGKKASLDALCERYAISNAHRVLHGALLDAQLLAEVYLAMTRGQESLMDVFEQPLELGGAHSGPRSDRKPLRVLHASEAELAAHEAVLDQMAGKGPCLWRPPVSQG
ncbi:MAG: DNA polymerase III subunit epsilon [Candidatus Dactylopiibacterium carminicum]|uniref:DNA polymerase III subunit epsilon n=1 Tax=Candidatus Dactylopiibacterium carminicum TaxID=857335 RepID=A0A272EV73_9RHOO|nr:DNA polymerase III subunit epsilon [Candidatus Dactylopiibacterium carminicum]KAF7599845.1 DNA polymerase III subunit epsilon [Candidatus Dactylopiibacterium carminicum]PAS93956.1 MAG: DNA polymerase III subunit epsilon [Candidatus Dactylopiibacterium carminicum]PAS97272.1 MAG: DNA polymerase III subunit epsilon [Candidatus Dactylopiibacterium carminicum]PAS99845.1 MAG: DNA polymerase III subunit epsilon [Candidatus Dactylopiibacterium carminicum]